jgi:hypothetical protein
MKALEILGFSLGEGEKIEASEANPRGYQESVVMTAISQEVMREMGLQWDTPAVLRHGWENAACLDRYYEEMPEKFIEKEFPGDSRVVWKDPRVCMTLPFWTRLLGEEPIVIVCVRNPAECAMSLWRRERMKPALSTALWRTHMSSVIRTASNPLFVDYARVISNPSGVWGELSLHLAHAKQKTGPHQLMVQKCQEWEEYVEAKLHRNQADLAELFNGKYDFGAAALYCNLARVGKNQLIDAIAPEPT